MQRSDETQSSGGMQGHEGYDAASVRALTEEDATGTCEEAGRKLQEWTQGSKAKPNALLHDHQPPRGSEQHEERRERMGNGIGATTPFPTYSPPPPR
jgi:hypothetical protein